MHRQKHPHRPIQRTAFTLIELLVVISIVSLLISILLPALAKSRESANAASCAQSAKQAGIAFQVYFNDYNGYYPAPYGLDLKTWYQKLEPYINGGPAYNKLRCASIPKEINNSSTLTYGYNLILYNIQEEKPDRVEELFYPSRTITLTDSIRKDRAGALHNYGGRSYLLVPESFSNPPYGQHGEVDYRHLDAANVLYLDGHVDHGTVPANDNTGDGNHIPWQGK